MSTHPHLAFLERKSRAYVRDWYVGGFVGFFIDSDSDAFYPHSSFSASGDPVADVRHAYRLLGPRGQSRLRDAVGAATIVANHNAAIDKVRRLTLVDRLRLAQVLGAMVVETGCVDGVLQIADFLLAVESPEDSGSIASYAFAIALRTLVELSLTLSAHTSRSKDAVERLKACLVRLIASTKFRSQYAPRCAHAYAVLDPSTFFEFYFEVLGQHISRLHEQDKEELAHAHATADFIVERMPKQLIQFAPRLQVLGVRARDRWLMNAWDSRDSQHVLIRTERDSRRIFLARRPSPGQNLSAIRGLRLTNDDFPKYEIRTGLSQYMHGGVHGSPMLTQALRGMESIIRPRVGK